MFNYLTAYAEQPHYKPLIVAPRDMAKTCIALIDREARHARRGRPARMIVKMNAVVDPPVIQALYRASQAGVEIDLIVRGQCALVPGVRGLSSRIRVRSIVGRFLEHSRIYYFENGGRPELYLGSADWMPRNLYERVEVMFPLKDKALKSVFARKFCRRIWPTLARHECWAQTAVYSLHRERGKKGFSVQDHLMALAHTDAHRAAELKERQTQLAHTNGRPAATTIHTSEWPIWKSRTPRMQPYDLIVIGSGPGGQRAAIQAAKAGKRVALVEKLTMLGGVCINTGTIPSKTMREAVLHLSGFYDQAFYGANYHRERTHHHD